MTEAEWLAATDPEPMLVFLGGRASERRLRLFGCACCRRVWDSLPGEQSRRAVEAAEQFADLPADPAAESDLVLAHAGADAETNPEAYDHENPAYWVSRRPCDNYVARQCAGWAAGSVSDYGPTEALERGDERAWRRMFAQEATVQAELVRDIFGNPFRPVAFDPAWRTSTVLALAEGIYADRAFGRMPIVADALQEAGCDHPDILAHCRGDGPHVRGCWVIALVLGKS